jgi:hypothetical protein
MSSTLPAGKRPAFDQPFAGFLDHPDLPLPGLLTACHFRDALKRLAVAFGTAANTILTPVVALWAWLSQVVFPDKATAAACVRVSELLGDLGRPGWSEDTGTYCRARARLPAPLIQHLAQGLAGRLRQAAPPSWLWRGRHAQLVDGTTLTLADTPENQAAFPQPASQKKGLGAPMVRLVVLACLATAAISGMAYGPYQGKGTSEIGLLHQLLSRLRPGDVVVADRYYCTYWVLAVLLLVAKVDVCVRLHHARKCDFRKGRRLGHLDHVVTWKRPPRPKGMSVEEYQQFPEQLTLREVGIDLPQGGRRSGRLVVATNLVDAQEYPKEAIAELYEDRWQVEVDLRSLKVTLQMRQLNCKTPERVGSELWTQLLGYNLVRKVMAQATLYQPPCKRPSRLRRGAKEARPLTPRQISFTAALRQVRGSWRELSTLSGEAYKERAEQVLKKVASKRVGQRPGRQEPRALKKRPRNRPVLDLPRAEVKKRLAEGKRGKASGISAPRRR